ncbi:MAG TPA: tetratricopeptide repeat protein, partial [Roseiflexaceae bacterium]|nr:tetratricopeptide repeat protein [Roseiflexaceae bacterium]
MQADELIEQWLKQADTHARRSWLAAHSAMLDDTCSMAIKDEANRLLRIDIRRSLAAADLLQQAGVFTGNAMLEALGLRAAGDAHAIGLGEFQCALEQYHAAAAIYERLGMQVERIRTEASTIWSLASLGQYERALAVGAAARDMLRQHEQWRPLATLMMNMAIIHGRLGNDLQALALLDDARAIWLTLDATAGPLARIDQNRAILLRNLGQFEQSIAASQASCERLTALGQHIEAARARQNLAVTYYTLGRYNEALQILDEVREQFRADGRERDSLLVGLFISDCLLQLRRFAAALAICQEARALFRTRGVTFEAAQSLMNEAIARAGLQQGDQALAALDEARAIFEGQGLATWVAACDLERAAVLAHQGRYAECARAADHSRQRFAERHLPVQELRATLLGARATAELGNVEQACHQAGEAVAEAERLQLAFLSYQGHHLLGRLLAERDPAASQQHFERAMAALERMRNHVMVEFRADFLDDKQAVYADAALLALAHGRIEDALLAVERAKSRVLRDLLAQRIDLSITPRSAADLPLTEELDQLQAERNRLVRRWESRELVREDPNLAEQERLQAHDELIAVEQRIIDLWHRLLVRNADYARDAALWLPHEEAALPRPESGTLLLEYAELRGRWMVFLVSAEQTRLV